MGLLFHVAGDPYERVTPRWCFPGEYIHFVLFRMPSPLLSLFLTMPAKLVVEMWSDLSLSLQAGAFIPGSLFIDCTSGTPSARLRQAEVQLPCNPGTSELKCGHHILFLLAKEGPRRYKCLSGGNRAKYWWTENPNFPIPSSVFSTIP